MNELCDICGIRPVTHRVQVTQNGQMAELNVCDIDYQRLRQQAGSSSPFESLFSGSNPFNSFEQAFARPERQQAAGLEALLSDTAKDIIQEAGSVAHKFGRSEVDTEHLLYALADNDVIAEILKQYKLKPSDIKGYIDANAPKGKQTTT